MFSTTYQLYSFDRMKKTLSHVGSVNGLLIREENSLNNQTRGTYSSVIRFISRENVLKANMLIQINDGYYQIDGTITHTDTILKRMTYYEATGKKISIPQEVTII